METFDIRSLFQLINKYKLLICSSAFIGTLIASLVTFFYLTSIYSASTQVLITQANNKNNTVQSSEVQANIQMVNTYTIILKSKELLREVAKDYPQFTTRELSEKIIAKSDANSQVINVIVTDKNPEIAVSLANDLTDKFISESKGLIKTNIVSVLSRAYIEDSKQPSGPNHKIHIIIGFLLGLFVSLFIILVKEIFDTTFKTENSVAVVLGLPVLGTINQIKNSEKGIK